MIKNKLLGGAFILSLGGIITKLIGVVYRIPLTNVLGAEGIGIYQMAFPFYTLLLTFSSTGVPNGISKLIAENKSSAVVIKSSIFLFSIIGFFFSILMAVFCYNLAVLQGNQNAWLSYLTLAPSVFLVSLISCFRGLFQGYSDMKPTAVSQVLEQTVKLVFGLTFCYLFRSNIVVSASLATLAVTISELVTVFYFIVKVKKRKMLSGFLKAKVEVLPIIKTVFPMMTATLIIPISRTIDSFLIINIISKYLSNATQLYGLYSGAVESIISMPVSVCYAVAVSVVPIISRLKSTNNDYSKNSMQAIVLTFSLSLVFAVLLLAFRNVGVNILYSKLTVENKQVISKMLKLSSLSVVGLSLMQTTVAIINASGNYKVSILSGVFSGVIKVLVSVTLLRVETLNVYGAIIADIFCYFVACFINLSYIIYSGYKNYANTGAKCIKSRLSA